MAVERARRDQPPQAPLHAQDALGGGLAGGLEDGLDDLLQRLPAAGRRSSTAGSRARAHFVDEPVSDLQRTPERLNSLLEWPLRFEAWLIGRGWRIPAGLSLVAIFRKHGMSLVDGAAAKGPATGEQAAVESAASRRRVAAPRARVGIGPQHAALAAILVLSGLLEFVRLGQNGFANIFYSAAVKSMLRLVAQLLLHLVRSATGSSPSTSRRWGCGCRR